MNALELADALEDFWCHYKGPEEPHEINAATLLRRQHEAIVKLREAVRIFQMGFEPDKQRYLIAKNALKDTEEFQ